MNRVLLCIVFLTPCLFFMGKPTDLSEHCKDNVVEEKIRTCPEDQRVGVYDPETGERTGVYLVVEQLPCLPGCDTLIYYERRGCTSEKLAQYLDENVVYPECAIQHGIQDTVLVTFIVAKTGCLADIWVDNDPGYGVGKAIQNTIKTMDNWIVGRQRGREVDVQIRKKYPVNIYSTKGIKK